MSNSDNQPEKRGSIFRFVWISILTFIVIFSLISLWKREATNLTISSFGGSYQNTLREAFFIPFTKSTGYNIIENTHSYDYSKIDAMVQSGNILWDIVEVESHYALKGIDKGYFETLNKDIVPIEKFRNDCVNDYAVAVECWAEVIAWNKQRIGDSPNPNSWADLWDLEKYPGKRAFEKRPHFTIVIALLADGVEPQNIYPIDDKKLKQAFDKLDEIKEHILWWSSGSELQQLMREGATIAAAWNGRIWSLMLESLELEYTMNHGIVDWTWWVVLKGAKNKSLAMQFLKSTARKEAGEIIMNEHGYGSPLVESPVPNDDIVNYIPTFDEHQNLMIFNAKWWAENEDTIMMEWEIWFAK